MTQRSPQAAPKPHDAAWRPEPPSSQPQPLPRPGKSPLNLQPPLAGLRINPPDRVKPHLLRRRAPVPRVVAHLNRRRKITQPLKPSKRHHINRIWLPTVPNSPDHPRLQPKFIPQIIPHRARVVQIIQQLQYVTTKNIEKCRECRRRPRCWPAIFPRPPPHPGPRQISSPPGQHSRHGQRQGASDR